MKKSMLCAILLLATASFATARPEVKKTFQANVQIHQQTISSESTCSATAIGPQALLTASHCELPTDDLEVSSLDKPVKIVGRMRDNLDHTIYLVNEPLKDYVPVTPNKLDPSDRVFIWGNPGELNDMYREGVFSGVHQDHSLFGEGPLELYFDINAFSGDSGAGVFDEQGNLVEVVSWTFVQGKGDNVHRMTGAYPLMFKPEELDRALKFTTPQKDLDCKVVDSMSCDEKGQCKTIKATDCKPKDSDVNQPNTPTTK